MKGLGTCQCSDWPGEPPCERTPTAEDLLCDECRPGCLQLIKYPWTSHSPRADYRWTTDGRSSIR